MAAGEQIMNAVGEKLLNAAGENLITEDDDCIGCCGGWYPTEPCECSELAMNGPPVFVPTGFIEPLLQGQGIDCMVFFIPPPPGVFDKACYTVCITSEVVTELPPGAVVHIPVNQLETCDECCPNGCWAVAIECNCTTPNDPNCICAEIGEQGELYVPCLVYEKLIGKHGEIVVFKAAGSCYLLTSGAQGNQQFVEEIPPGGVEVIPSGTIYTNCPTCCVCIPCFCPPNECPQELTLSLSGFQFSLPGGSGCLNPNPPGDYQPFGFPAGATTQLPKNCGGGSPNCCSWGYGPAEFCDLVPECCIGSEQCTILACISSASVVCVGNAWAATANVTFKISTTASAGGGGTPDCEGCCSTSFQFTNPASACGCPPLNGWVLSGGGGGCGGAPTLQVAA